VTLGQLVLALGTDPWRGGPGTWYSPRGGVTPGGVLAIHISSVPQLQDNDNETLILNTV